MKAEAYVILDLYVGQFAARHDAYVKNSNVHIHAPLTPEVANAAFSVNGAFSVSGYMSHRYEADDGIHDVTHIGAIDFDMPDGMEKARLVRSFLSSHDIESLLVGSRRGAHLWVTTYGTDGGMVPSAVLRRALTTALVLLDIDTVKAEVFPKKAHSPWGVGALRMPLMKHPKTGVRYPAYDPFDDREVTRLGDLVNLMADLTTAYEAFRRLAGPEVGHVTPTAPSAGYGLPSPVSGQAAPSASALLVGLGVNAVPGRSVRCPFHDDRHASLSVADDDERVWCKAPECPIYNGETGLGSIALREYLERSHVHHVPPYP